MKLPLIVALSTICIMACIAPDHLANAHGATRGRVLLDNPMLDSPMLDSPVRACDENIWCEASIVTSTSFDGNEDCLTNILCKQLMIA